MPFSLPAGGRFAALALTFAVALGTLGGTAATASAEATVFGPLPPRNPATAGNGTAGMHGDSASSDTTPYPGPGTGKIACSRTALASACPTIVVGADGYVVTLCTTIFGQTPTAHLLAPATGADLASLALPKGSLFGGVYSYLDNNDRLVAVDGNNNLARIGHHRTGSRTGWALTVDQSTPLAGAVPAGDNIVGLSPAWNGKVWFATTDGVIGTADTDTGTVRTLATGEGVQNSISTVPGHTAVATDHALYLLSEAPDGTPVINWRAPYDRGPARKPGRLSWGAGATPSFFGPGDGTEYVTITDNAAPHEKLLVYRVDGGPTPICSTPVLTQYANSGTEEAVIASGRSVFVTGPTGSAGLNTFASYHHAVLDPATGAQLTSSFLGIGLVYNRLQMTGTTGPDGTLHQGTETGVVRITKG